jgi:hypothetical protein
MEGWQVTTYGCHAVSSFRGFKSLVSQDDRDGVDQGVDRLDAPEMCLDDFLTGNLPGSNGFGQLRGAQSPEVGSCDAQVNTSLYVLVAVLL